MSDFGLFLIMFAGVMALIIMIRFFAWLTDVSEAGGLRAYLGRGTQKYVEVRPVQTVKHSQIVMSPVLADDPQTEQTDIQTDRASEADQWIDKIEVDRTKTAVIELLVYSGWDVGEIRNVVKGDNGTIGAEVKAARQRLGMETYRTPIADRPSEASYQN